MLAGMTTRSDTAIPGVTSKREAAKQGACSFCEIATDASTARIVFEDAISLAFLDHRPLFAGHCLLITRKHYVTISDLPEDLVGPLFLNARMLAAAVQRAMNADGTFIAINNIVSQSVPHFHIHIVPRKRGDGLRGFFWPRHKIAEEDAGRVQQAIAAAVEESR